MNFDFTEEQQVVSDLAKQLFGDLAPTERVKQVAAEGGFDADLWAALADAGLLGLCLPESAGGSGMGMVELALIAEQQGRNVALVPFAAATIAARAVANHLSNETDVLAGVVAGTAIVTTALAERGRNDPFTPGVTATDTGEGMRVVGEKPAVPGLPHATHVLVPASNDGNIVIALIATDAEGVSVEPLKTTNEESQGHLVLDTVVDASRVISTEGVLDQLVNETLAANSALQLGVCQGSIAHAAEHVATRQQFGRPLSAFQAVSQRAADGYITTEALRTTVLNAAWQVDHSDDPTEDVLSATWWASEGAQQVVLAGQHLHGGLGADVDHPVHRYFLWGMQLANTLGSGSAHLERLGRVIAAQPAS